VLLVGVEKQEHASPEPLIGSGVVPEGPLAGLFFDGGNAIVGGVF